MEPFQGAEGERVAYGLFANRNHLAALLYGLTPLAAAWIGGLAPAAALRAITLAPAEMLGVAARVAGRQYRPERLGAARLRAPDAHRFHLRHEFRGHAHAP